MPAPKAKPAAPGATTDEAPKKAKKSGKLLWIILLVLAMAIAGGTAYWFMAPGDKAAGEATHQAPPQYIALEPAFVVNLADADATRYLQVDVQLMTRDPETATAINLHMPIIRNRLLLLFGQKNSKELNIRSGKEKLQQQALDEVRAALKKQHAANKVDALLFTSLVIQ